VSGTTLFELRVRAASALRWSIVGRIGTQIIRWAATLIVIRLLAPEDYGLMAMAMAVIAFAALFNELGANAVIVRNAGLSREEIGSIQGLVAVLNLTLGGILYAMAPLIAQLYESDVTAVLRGCCLVFPAFAVAIVQEALLIRDMDFRSRMLVETTAQLTGSLTALLLAWLGAAVWALVVGMIVTRMIMAAGFFLLVPERFPWRLDWRDLRPYIGFAAALSLQRAVSWLYVHFTTFVLGTFNSATLLGLYSIGKDLAFLPIDKFGSVLNQVGFATYARSQDFTKGIRRALEKSLDYLIFLFTPYAILGAVMAPIAIEAVLGEQWLAVVPMAQLFLIALPFRAFNTQLAEAFNAAGQAGVALQMHAANAVLALTCIISGSFWSIEGAAAGWAVAMPLAYANNLRIAKSALGLDTRRIMAAHLRPLACAGVAAAVTWSVALSIQLSSALLELAVMMTAGACTLITVMLLLDRTRMIELIRFLRG